MPRYNPVLAGKICHFLSEGEALGDVLKRFRPQVPRRVVWGWRQDHPEFRWAFDNASMCGAEKLAEEVISIADALGGLANKNEIAAARLQTDVRRWKASKLLSDLYGDTMAVTGKGGKDLIPVENPATRIPRLMAVLAVAMPDTDNTQLFELASRMIERVDAMGETSRGQANGHDP